MVIPRTLGRGMGSRKLRLVRLYSSRLAGARTGETGLGAVGGGAVSVVIAVNYSARERNSSPFSRGLKNREFPSRKTLPDARFFKPRLNGRSTGERFSNSRV